MCGRFTLRTPAQQIAQLFDASVPDLAPRFNIAPSQDVATVRLDQAGEKRELAFLRWGLVPSWADEPKTGYSMINARAETVAEKPSFRRAFKKRRCLIPADGFYEWKKVNGKKQPHYIHMADDQPFAFAGLWEHWERGGERIESCTIIVTEANDVLKPIHNRMPVILSPDNFDLWLDPTFENREKLQSLLRPYTANEMEAHPVSTIVNNPRNDVEDCIEALDE